MTENPFHFPNRSEPWVALTGYRCGYIQLSANQARHDRFAHVDATLLSLGLDWAQQLENLGAQRVYWVCLSEQVPHLHWHLYPRWPDDTEKGLTLFEQRDNPSLQPAWEASVEQAFIGWCKRHQVFCPTLTLNY